MTILIPWRVMPRVVILRKTGLGVLTFHKQNGNGILASAFYNGLPTIELEWDVNHIPCGTGCVGLFAVWQRYLPR